jgi:hypothetical protein
MLTSRQEVIPWGDYFKKSKLNFIELKMMIYLKHWIFSGIFYKSFHTMIKTCSNCVWTLCHTYFIVSKQQENCSSITFIRIKYQILSLTF